MNPNCKDEKKPFYDLIYAGVDVEKAIKAKYPDAVIKDASDEIHTERFEVEIPDVSDDEFYPFAMRQGFVRCCLSFEFLLGSLRFKETKLGKHGETMAKIKKWVEIAKKEGGTSKNEPEQEVQANNL